jgi:hypothetical protein
MNQRTQMLLGLSVSLLGACGTSPEGPPLISLLATDVPAGSPYSVVRIDPERVFEIVDVGLSENYLYLSIPWGGVYRLPKFGGAITTVQQDRNSWFDGISVNGDAASWIATSGDGPNDTGHTRVDRQLVSGGPVATLYEGYVGNLSVANVPTLQADGAVVYAVVASNQSASVIAIPASGGTPTQVMTAPAGGGLPSFPTWIAAGGYVYFAACPPFSPTDPPAAEPCSIRRAPGTGGEAEDFALIPSSPLRVVAADLAYVYVSGQDAFWRVDRQTGAVSVVEMGGMVPWIIVLDETHFFFSPYVHQLWSVPKAGGAPTLVADLSGHGGMDKLLQDGQHLFALVGYQEVLVVPKTPVTQP